MDRIGKVAVYFRVGTPEQLDDHTEAQQKNVQLETVSDDTDFHPNELIAHLHIEPEPSTDIQAESDTQEIVMQMSDFSF